MSGLKSGLKSGMGHTGKGMISVCCIAVLLLALPAFLMFSIFSSAAVAQEPEEDIGLPEPSLDEIENITDISAGYSGIEPPSIPEEESGEGAAERAGGIRGFSKLAESAAEMQQPTEQNEYVFFLQHPQTHEPISDIHLEIVLYDRTAKQDTKTLRYVPEGAALTMQLEPGHSYDITLKGDVLGTAGRDYYTSFAFDTRTDGQEKTATLFPAGSVSGIVYEDSNAVRGATVKFECSSAYGDLTPVTTDGFGSFFAAYLPEGPCRILAATSRKVGFTQVTVKQGESLETEIELERGLIGGRQLLSGLLPIIIMFIIFASGIAYFISAMRRRMQRQMKHDLKKLQRLGEEFSHRETDREAEEKEPERKPEREQEKTAEQQGQAQAEEGREEPGPAEKAISEPKEALSNTLKNILRTLPGKERPVMECILKSAASGSEEYTKYTTQARLRNELALPKTTLARILSSLEARKLITIETIGKLKKVKLTDWVLKELKKG